ncbi:hypothetical protein EMCG_00736 [[Emmonsia] crescens]|uniref:F-box domain-containing protein n=1 Tax=[Emmonsia] crescens TaxID=73230 RepID=A0A0G2HRY7_9EURO|nr:hypothetical protein EMCG_00736 [Emmonsia crescens UAMH 3008]
MAGWTDLANELLYGIFDFLPNSDVKNIRLTCRFLYTVTPLTLSRVFISPFKRDLEVLRSVANHPVFSQQITEIVWDDRRLHLDEARHIEIAQFYDTGVCNVQSVSGHLEQVDESRYVDGRRGSLQKALIGLYGHMGEWERAHHLLLRLYDEQQSVLDSCEDVETFRFALQAFPCLRRVTIADNCLKKCVEWHRYSTPLMRSLPSWLLKPWPCSILGNGNVCYMVGPTLRGYYAAVRELSRSPRTVSEFIMEPSCRGVDLINDLNIFNSSKEDFIFLIMRNNLTSLEYTLDGYVRLHPTWHLNDIPKSILRMTLSCAQALEHFALNTNVEPSRSRLLQRPMPLLDILPMERWRVLRTFSLRNFVLTLRDFILFLSALPATITSLEFHMVIFFRTTWEEALYYLRDRSGWGSDPDLPLPTLTVSLRLEHSSTQIVILRDELKRFFERKAPNPFTTLRRPGFTSHGNGVTDDSVLPGFGRVVDDVDAI